MEKLFNLKTASDYLKISQRKLKRLVKKGRLPAYKIGGSYIRFKKEDLDNFKIKTPEKETRPLLRTKRNNSIAGLFESAKDFFYFNSFYLISIIIAVIMLIILLRF